MDLTMLWSINGHAPCQKTCETRFPVAFEDQEFHPELTTRPPLNFRQFDRYLVSSVSEIDFQADVTSLANDLRGFDGASSQRQAIHEAFGVRLIT